MKKLNSICPLGSLETKLVSCGDNSNNSTSNLYHQWHNLGYLSFGFLPIAAFFCGLGCIAISSTTQNNRENRNSNGRV